MAKNNGDASTASNEPDGGTQSRINSGPGPSQQSGPASVSDAFTSPGVSSQPARSQLSTDAEGAGQTAGSKADAKARGSDGGFAQRSTLYQEFLAERDEILKHKWIESEKHGKDIGFERALLDWIRKHRESWRKTRDDRKSF